MFFSALLHQTYSSLKDHSCTFFNEIDPFQHLTHHNWSTFVQMVDWSISSNQSQFWGSTILTTLKKILLVVPCPNFSHTPLVKTQHCSLGITGSATSAIIDTKVSTKSTATSLPCQHLHLQYYHINTSTLLTYNCHAHDRAPLILSLYMICVSFLTQCVNFFQLKMVNNKEKKN